MIDSLTFVQYVLMLYSNRNEFLRVSSRIEPLPPNIRNDIVYESGMTRSSSRLEKKIMKPHESTEALEGHFYLLLITYYLLLITYYLLLITYYLSLITYYLLLIISFITPRTAGNSKYTFPVTAVAVVVVVVVVVAVYL